MPASSRAFSGRPESLAAVADRGRALLAAAGAPPETARRDATLLARHLLGWTGADWAARAGEPAPPGFVARFLALVERRVASEPVAYLTGEREFFGRSFVVTRDVLIPRPETELVVEEALERVRRQCSGETTALRIIDIGTGSGCLAVTLALECPAARVLATDVSSVALEVARSNAGRLGASNRVTFAEGAWLAGFSGPFDLVVSNPPYVAKRDRPSLPREVADYEPGLALFGGTDGLDVIRALLPAAAQALAPSGWLVMEIGLGQLEAVHDLVDHTPGLRFEAARPDLQGIPRVVSCRHLD